MKNVLLILAVVALLAVPAMAADVSKDTLSKMGLSSISVISDAQGMAIRGMGFSLAYGKSYAKVCGAKSENGYLAIDKSCGCTLAGGANLSVAGTIQVGGAPDSTGIDSVPTQPVNGCVTAKVVFAGGASIAFTK